METKRMAEVGDLSLEQKASLCSGMDFWRTKPIDPLDIPSIMVSDGPHGLRKQDSDEGRKGLGTSRPATCFPPACTSACSFDVKLMRQIGEAIGDEAREQDVAVVLGPAVNIKRSPLCGRNFEYISEDPHLAGEMAAAFIKGVQSKGVGTSIKHFAANNQETSRFICNSMVDERALREIYLAGFETAVKQGKPWTLMCSYNPVNGVYACENKHIMEDILRNEWGYKGVAVTDWGAITDRVKALQVGLDWEMPGPAPENDRCIVEACRNGSLPEDKLNETVQRMLTLISNAQKRPRPPKNPYEENRNLARRAALESAVLLKNDGLLPINKGTSIAVIGAFAKETRFQGGGSSRIRTTAVKHAYEGFEECGGNFVYEDGYCFEGDGTDLLKKSAAVRLAERKDAVVIFAGLPDEYESEGFDRMHMNLPAGQNALIEEVAAANPNVVVVLYAGSPVTMPWISKVRSVLMAYLPGQEGASAIPALIYGDAVPSGKLAETFPLAIEDTPCHSYFGTRRYVEYRESVFVGYRYYDASKTKVLFPFGHGLSYSKFEYGNMVISSQKVTDTDTLKVTVDITNVGNYEAAEVVQLYVSAPKSKLYKPVRELRAFAKVMIPKDKTKTVSFTLDGRDFSFYNVDLPGWQIETGIYDIQIGASSQDIRLTGKVSALSVGKRAPVPDYTADAPAYYNVPANGMPIPRVQFEKIYGKTITTPERPRRGNHTLNSTVSEISDTRFGAAVAWFLRRSIMKQYRMDPREDQIRMMEAMTDDLPLRGFVSLSSGAVTRAFFDGAITVMNGHPFKGVKIMILARKESKKS
ncbi:MAG: glycoside hydrolase family 3 C-terminal domain-containing protein [Oscillospiraceae bacterium]|nr:glycoside hydrolase family 3 C-terminal domain-containing protein [Oscillospiraceae bacterium]